MFATAKPMTAEQAADFLGVTVRTVYGYFREGLEARRVGPKRIYTTIEAIERFSRPYLPEVEQPSHAQQKLAERFGI